MARKLKNMENNKQAIGLGIWQENGKTWKMRHKNCMTWNVASITDKCGN